MRLEGLQVERDGDSARRSVGLAWIGGAARLTIEVPSAYAPPDDDLSPFVPVALLSAMRRAEPLQIHGRVSARLLERLTLVQEIVSAWNPTLTRVRVRAAAADNSGGEPAAGRAAFFSRGIDSTYSAAIARPPGEELACLVHWREFEPSFSQETIKRSVGRAHEAAARIGLPLVEVGSDVHLPLRDVVDFDDATSAMLAAAALSLPGLAGRFVIPSSFGYADLNPVGTHPLLDALWSTEQVALEHDSCVPDRDDKVEWLVSERPDLLDILHFCVEHDSADNCWECRKCIWTMLLLHIHGGLQRAGGPPRIDPALVRRTPRTILYHLAAWERAHAALGDSPEDTALRRAIRASLRAGGRNVPAREQTSMHLLRRRRLHFHLRGRLSDLPATAGGVATAEVGELDPALPPPRTAPASVLGLVRAVDHEARRHRYAAGALPPGQRSGELGALLSEPPEEGVPLALGSDGRPHLGVSVRSGPPLALARWVAEPLAWRRAGPPVPRIRSVGRRLVDARRHRRREPAPAEANPAGWLYRRGGDGRVALLAAAHPVLDDVLLTTDPDEPAELGYRPPIRLGFLEGEAPVTGALGVSEVAVPWARRWGRRG